MWPGTRLSANGPNIEHFESDVRGIEAEMGEEVFDMQDEEEYEKEVQTMSAEFGEEHFEFGAEELEEFYQMAMSTHPENPGQAFSAILEHEQSKLRRQHGWPGGSQ